MRQEEAKEDTVPLEPLCKWLAGYAMPPNGDALEILQDIDKREQAWKDFLKGLVKGA